MDAGTGGGPDGGVASNPHAGLTWQGPGTCVACHEEEATEVHGSVHYQWMGDAPLNVNQPGVRQGKLTNAVNSYCVNITGNWKGCGACHTGLGAMPEPVATIAQLQNIDCLLCHQDDYRRANVDGTYVPDLASMTITMDEAVQTVHLPTRQNCLQCHAKAGGGDAVKRGDLALAHAATTDRTFDVHMSTTGANLSCQGCHVVQNHRFAGKGSDLRVSDSAAEMDCATCHASPGHDATVARHTARVACQTCHVPTYARDAADTAATEATEIHRTWLATNASVAPFHPASTKANDLTPAYRWWNRYSDTVLLGDVSSIDPLTGAVPTSRPLGDVADAQAKVYPFKHKTAEQPITRDTNVLIALDTSVFFATANADAAVQQGLVNMGLAAGTAYDWTMTDTYQLLNHEVAPSGQALTCEDCHASTSRIDLMGELGYELRADQATICSQCHREKSSRGFTAVHERHVTEKGYDCSWCHTFSRAERGLTMP